MMRIDLPQCNFKNCRFSFDGNCTNKIEYDRCEYRIEEDELIKAEPVQHGRWIDKGEYAVCTECGGRSGTQYDGVVPIPLMTQYCPNCGAKMDGGDENEDGVD